MWQEITQAISTVGFPIVACGAMFWKVNDQDKKHSEEMDSLRETIDNNTKAVNALTATIEFMNK